ncbi:hypothetical protein [Secundilactobacillus kimchicus]|uniref:hypothetical protein n=1 Tax=Secundilactobacillus kimchicus TaxID=528209 RepID=UPI0024A9D17F|nr:hypothetical protein [Secundilactobacillus kimchicus]
MINVVKRSGDVNFAVTIRPLVNGKTKPKMLLFTKGGDDQLTEGLFQTIYDVADEYSENTSVYPYAEAAFDTTNFDGPLEIVSTPNVDIAVPYNVAITPTSDGATVKAELTPPLVYAASQHLYDGAYYATVDDSFTDEEITQLADFLYENQRVQLVTEVKSVADLKTNYDHVQNTQLKDNTLGNWFNIVNSQSDTKKQAVQIAAYAAANMPVELSHIGGQTEFVQDPNLYREDQDTIASMNGATIVDKADDLMVLQGKNLAGNYVDQFVHMQYATDAFTDALQKYENRMQFPQYTDDTINEMEKTLETTGTALIQMGILYGDVVITKKPRAEVLNSEVADRRYNYFGIEIQLMDTINKINGRLQITL